MDILIVVDMQCGVFETGRSGRAELCVKINALSAAVRGRGGHVIWVQQTDENMPSDSAAWRILPELTICLGDSRVEKHVCDGFYSTDLEDRLRQACPDRIIFCGCDTDFCLDSMVRHAATIGLPAWVASDAHTTGDKRYATAQQIITHHNYIWDNFIGSGDPIFVVETADLL